MLSKVKKVISDWLGGTVPNLFVPEPKNIWLHSSLPFGQGVEIFSAIRMRKKYYRLADCLDGAGLAGYNLSGDGRVTSLLLFRSHPARRRGNRPTGQTRPVQVGRIEENFSLFPCPIPEKGNSRSENAEFSFRFCGKPLDKTQAEERLIISR